MTHHILFRPGKMQLAALAESGFDPLSRSCRFMLTEEAHHLFVGETGVGRTIEATCAAMNKAGITDPYDVERIRALGVVDLPLLQRKAKQWPGDADLAFIGSLMKACVEPGRYASWIAPPRMGINQQPLEFEYVKID